MSYKHRARFCFADRGRGFSFFRREESLRARARRRVVCAVGGVDVVGLRWSGRSFIFSAKIRVVVSGEWARERRVMAGFGSLGGIV